jgi:hypothetical protein
VSAWYDTVERSTRPRMAGHIGPGPATRWSRGAYVLNASELPVYDVMIEFHVVTATVNDEDQTVEVGAAVHRRIVPPGTIFVDGPEKLSTRLREIKEFAVSISYRDTAGRRWIRDANGVLEEDPDRNLPRPAMPRPRVRRTLGSLARDRRAVWPIAALVVAGVVVLLFVV